MYLIVFGHHHEMTIVKANTLKEALAFLYDSFGVSYGVNYELFKIAISQTTERDAIHIFNALLPDFQIKQIYSGLTPEYMEDKNGSHNNAL